MVIDGRVLDVSSFVDSHPGGARAFQSLAGTDATAVWEEIHAPLPDFVPWMDSLAVVRPPFICVCLATSKYTSCCRVSWLTCLGLFQGRLAGKPQMTHQARPANPLAPWEDFTATQLDSPFPCARFQGSGLEAFRFEWGILDRLVRFGAHSMRISAKMAVFPHCFV